jgi:hypothetical protein
LTSLIQSNAAETISKEKEEREEQLHRKSAPKRTAKGRKKTEKRGRIAAEVPIGENQQHPYNSSSTAKKPEAVEQKKRSKKSRREKEEEENEEQKQPMVTLRQQPELK